MHLIRIGWGLSWISAWELVGLISKLLVITAIPAIVVYWERRSLTSIGMRGMRLGDMFAALAIVLVYLQIDPRLARVAYSLPVVAAELTTGSVLYASLPKWLDISGLLANAVAEEIGYRGYAIERIEELTGSTILAATFPLIVNVLVHGPIWGLHGMFVKFPILLLFVALYFWRRSLPACVIVHLIIDIRSFEF